MKVVAINSSPREGGNTSILLGAITEELQKEGVETEIIKIGGLPIRGCMACRKCWETKDKECIIKNDIINPSIAKMDQADGLILASPTYFADVNAEMKAFIDRTGYVSNANGRLWKRKVCAAITAVRRGGATHTFDTMNHYFQIGQALVVGSTYWNMVYGLNPGDVKGDQEGLANMRDLAQNMAWLIKKIKA